MLEFLSFFNLQITKICKSQDFLLAEHFVSYKQSGDRFIIVWRFLAPSSFRYLPRSMATPCLFIFFNSLPPRDASCIPKNVFVFFHDKEHGREKLEKKCEKSNNLKTAITASQIFLLEQHLWHVGHNQNLQC